MGELADVMGIFGAVDGAVLENPDLVGPVGALLCPYADGAAGWFARYESWVRSRRGPGHADDVILPTADGALAAMATRDPQGAERSRRLLALTVLSRVQADYEPGGAKAEAVAAALVALTPDHTLEEARALHGFLADVADYAGADELPTLYVKAMSARVLDPATGTQIPPSCHPDTEMVKCEDGTEREALRIQTQFCIPGVTLEDVEPFLDPGSWPRCASFWCSMQKVDTGRGRRQPVQEYVEVVGTDCDDPSQQMTTTLLFRTERSKDSIHVNFALAHDDKHPSDGTITCDSGYIIATEDADGVCITTEKVAAFDIDFTAAALAMFICASGYGTYGEQMANTCVVRHPVPSKPTRARRSRRGAATDGRAHPRRSGPGRTRDRMVPAAPPCGCAGGPAPAGRGCWLALSRVRREVRAMLRRGRGPSERTQGA